MSEEPAQEMLHNPSESVKCSAENGCKLHQKEVNPIQSCSWSGEGTVKDLRGVRPNKYKYISLSSIYTSRPHVHTRARRAYAYEGGVRNLPVRFPLFRAVPSKLKNLFDTRGNSHAIQFSFFFRSEINLLQNVGTYQQVPMNCNFHQRF